MKILLCSPVPLVREMGASKVLIELGEALTRLGWDVASIGPSDVQVAGAGRYADALRSFLNG